VKLAKPLTTKDTKVHEGKPQKTMLCALCGLCGEESLTAKCAEVPQRAKASHRAGFCLGAGAGLAEAEIFQHSHSFLEDGGAALRNLAIGRHFVDQHGEQLGQV
jgi:hypothetical protein